MSFAIRNWRPVAGSHFLHVGPLKRSPGSRNIPGCTVISRSGCQAPSSLRSYTGILGILPPSVHETAVRLIGLFGKRTIANQWISEQTSGVALQVR